MRRTHHLGGRQLARGLTKHLKRNATTEPLRFWMISFKMKRQLKRPPDRNVETEGAVLTQFPGWWCFLDRSTKKILLTHLRGVVLSEPGLPAAAPMVYLRFTLPLKKMKTIWTMTTKNGCPYLHWGLTICSYQSTELFDCLRSLIKNIANLWLKTWRCRSSLSERRSTQRKKKSRRKAGTSSIYQTVPFASQKWRILTRRFAAISAAGSVSRGKTFLSTHLPKKYILLDASSVAKKCDNWSNCFSQNSCTWI